jgi:hypothetical protein|tara:strand:+ start:362 stop:643 length:282 start_codon:yes stop_codon:yes gene_type:complete
MIDVFKAGDIARVISDDPQSTHQAMIVIRQDNDAGVTICDNNGIEYGYDTDDLEHVTEEEVRDRIRVIRDKISELTDVISHASNEINDMMRKI